MCADHFVGHVVRARLAGGQRSLDLLGRLLDASQEVTAFEIDDRGHLTAFLMPEAGEEALVRALEVSGVHPLATAIDEVPGFGGPRAC